MVKYLVLFFVVYLALGVVSMPATLILKGYGFSLSLSPGALLWILLWPVYVYMFWIGGYVIG